MFVCFLPLLLFWSTPRTYGKEEGSDCEICDCYCLRSGCGFDHGSEDFGWDCLLAVSLKISDCSISLSRKQRLIIICVCKTGSTFKLYTSAHMKDPNKQMPFCISF